MATRTIGLELKIDGVTKSVSSIKQLEGEIKNLKNKLKEVEIGSDEFNKLQKEIKVASGELNTFNEKIKGVSLDKQLAAVGKFTAGVTSGFAAATAASQLFGNETKTQEQITQAATTAQNLLTVALGARALQETLVSAKTLIQVASTKAATLATTAQRIATRGLTASLRTLYATMLANPFTAILAVVGALTAAYFAFSDSVDEAAKSTQTLDEATKNLQGTYQKDSSLLETNVRLINASNTSDLARLRLKKEILQVLPGLNKEFDKNNKLTARGIEITRKYIEFLRIEEEISFKRNKLLEARNQYEVDGLVLNSKNLDASEKIAAVNRRVFNSKLINSYEQDIQKLSESAEKLSTELTKYTDARKEEIKLTKEYNLLVQDELQILREQLKLRRELIKVTVDSIPDVTKLKEVENEYNRLNNSIKLLRDNLKKLTFEEDFGKNFTEQFKKLTDGLKFQNDSFAIEILNFRKRFSEAVKNNERDVKSFRKTIDDVYKTIREQLNQNIITPEQFNATKTLLDTYVQIFNEVRGEFATPPEVKFGQEFINEFFEITKRLKVLKGEILFDFDTISKEIKPSVADITDGYSQILDDYTKKIKSSKEKLTRILLENTPLVVRGEELNDLLDKELKTAEIRLGRGTEELFKERKKIIEKYFNLFSDLYKKASDDANTRIENVINTTNAIVDEEQRIIQELKKQQDLENEIRKQQSDARVALFVNETEKIIELTNLRIKTIAGEEQSFNDFREKEGRRLAALLPDLEQLTADERERVLNAFYERLTTREKSFTQFRLTELKKQQAQLRKQLSETMVSEDESDLQPLINQLKKVNEEIKILEKSIKGIDLDDLFGNLQTYIQTFSNSIFRIAQITQTQFTMELELLESNYQKTLDGIVGDTEEANEKRLEAETIYQQKKKDIEKKARIASLQATLIQTLASAAQAVVSTLANPTLGPGAKAVIIGIEGLLATAQIQTIKNQIQQAQNLRRGGRIDKFGNGGMVYGPSHEQGGVQFGRFELEGNEAVINRQSTLNYGGLLSSINQSGGGRPIINNVLDSRLVEVLAKGRQEPIRAYVFESDITNVQTINRKLEQLTTL